MTLPDPYCRDRARSTLNSAPLILNGQVMIPAGATFTTTSRLPGQEIAADHPHLHHQPQDRGIPRRPRSDLALQNLQWRPRSGRQCERPSSPRPREMKPHAGAATARPKIPARWLFRPSRQQLHKPNCKIALRKPVEIKPEEIVMNDKPTQAPHGCSASADHDREVPEIDLLSPLAPPRRHALQSNRDVAHVPVLR